MKIKLNYGDYDLLNNAAYTQLSKLWRFKDFKAEDGWESLFPSDPQAS